MPLFHHNVADTFARYDGLRLEAPSYCGDTLIDTESEREREMCVCVCIYTSSTAQGGGGSFKNRKPIYRRGWLL